MIKQLFLFPLLFISLILAGQDNKFIPDCVQGSLVSHKHYLLSYAEQHEQAEWVSYELRANELKKNARRKDNFRPDPMIIHQSAALSDYRGSNYDRGHLAPAADMTHSELAMSESFYLSNMSPQVPGFNRGIWKELEAQVRKWALDRGVIYVVCGPVLSDNLKQIGANEVSIPTHYYKIVFDAESNEILGFVFPNKASKEALHKFCCPVDQIEQLTALDFFPQLPDALEAQLESEVNTADWFNEELSKEKVLSAELPGSGTTLRCKGKTQKGKPCSRKVKSGADYCFQHKG